MNQQYVDTVRLLLTIAQQYSEHRGSHSRAGTGSESVCT